MNRARILAEKTITVMQRTHTVCVIATRGQRKPQPHHVRYKSNGVDKTESIPPHPHCLVKARMPLTNSLRDTHSGLSEARVGFVRCSRTPPDSQSLHYNLEGTAHTGPNCEVSQLTSLRSAEESFLPAECRACWLKFYSITCSDKCSMAQMKI